MQQYPINNIISIRITDQERLPESFVGWFSLGLSDLKKHAKNNYGSKAKKNHVIQAVLQVPYIHRVKTYLICPSICT